MNSHALLVGMSTGTVTGKMWRFLKKIKNKNKTNTCFSYSILGYTSEEKTSKKKKKQNPQKQIQPLPLKERTNKKDVRQPWHGFYLWPRNFNMPWAWKKEKGCSVVGCNTYLLPKNTSKIHL